MKISKSLLIFLMIGVVLILFFLVFAKKIKIQNSGFEAAHAVMSKNCFSCHSQFEQNTESEWLNSRYIVPGNSAESLLLIKLKNKGGNMPPQGMISDSDAQALSIWIEKMKNRTSTSDLTRAEFDPNLRFTVAQKIISLNCGGCHNVVLKRLIQNNFIIETPSFVNFTSEGQYVDAGFVIPQNSERSQLFRILNQLSVAHSSQKVRLKLDQTEIRSLRVWIDYMGVRD